MIQSVFKNNASKSHMELDHLSALTLSRWLSAQYADKIKDVNAIIRTYDHDLIDEKRLSNKTWRYNKFE